MEQVKKKIATLRKELQEAEARAELAEEKEKASEARADAVSFITEAFIVML